MPSSSAAAEGDVELQVGREPHPQRTCSTTSLHSASLPITAGGTVLGHKHYSQRAPWLRAFVLGANDGLVSVAALMLGVGAGNDERNTLLLSGVAGLVAGAFSMACGEFVSVASQRDAEAADIAKEVKEHAKGPEARARELDELAKIYEDRGISAALARQVAEELTEKDVIRAHARDELGIDIDELANPLQASVVSAVAFSVGAAIPIIGALISKDQTTMLVLVAVLTAGGSHF
mmetsp:Transcript_46348/g.148515  ORF Transcript_46348/g.148515 Transcript_46348/m.148515 type:complete len:234 (+) Transcript_46348:1277-1978(+)